jgi:hypothetical protein
MMEGGGIGRMTLKKGWYISRNNYSDFGASLNMIVHSLLSKNGSNQGLHTKNSIYTT